MKNKALLILISILIFSCGNDDDDGTIPSRKEYSFTQNSSITVEVFEESFIAQVIEGNNLVFEYLFVSENDPDISDEEFSEKIIFEIDPTLDNFTYVDDDLATINTYYTKSCFCANINSQLIYSGAVQGTKQNNGSWDISIDISFTQNETQINKSASGNFTLE